jgi:DeoR/GlpR family transcriptional regulator of sugar metabolism
MSNKHQTWTDKRKGTESEAKAILARYTFQEYVDGRHAATVMPGTGTTPEAFVACTYEEQREHGESLDLTWITVNKAVDRLHEREVAVAPRLFESTEVVVLGGISNHTLEAYLGSFAADAINRVGPPDLLVMGAFALAFDGRDVKFGYKYDSELTIQNAHATRKTSHRIVLVDGSKLGRHALWTVPVRIEDVLRETPRCTIITTEPKSPKPEFTAQVEQFSGLLTRIQNSDTPEFDGKEFELIVLNRHGKVAHKLSLSEQYEPKQLTKVVEHPIVIPPESTLWFDSWSEGPFTFDQVTKMATTIAEQMNYHLASEQPISQYTTLYEYITTFEMRQASSTSRGRTKV